MNEKMINDFLDRAVEAARKRTTAIGKGEYPPRIEVIVHGQPLPRSGPPQPA
jgi:hypothetical protein